MKPSPYRASAGSPPPQLAGRDTLIERFDESLATLQRGGATNPRALIGVRGLGKTVLLREFKLRAIERDWYPIEIETRRQGAIDEQLLSSLAACVREIRPSKAALKRLLDVAQSALTISVRTPEPLELEWAISAKMRLRQEVGQEAGGELLKVMSEVTTIVAGRKNGLVLLVDELHESRAGQLESLVTALHKLQSSPELPIHTVVAGLPQLPKLLVDNRSYAERLFRLDALGSLTSEQVGLALNGPAKCFGRSFDDEAVLEIDRQTLGYPYFVQEWGDQLWRHTQTPQITVKDVEAARPHVLVELDQSFYSLRTANLSGTERAFVVAMSKLDKEAPIAEIAKLMNKSVTDVSVVRQRLLDKGAIVATSRGRVAFAIPGYGAHLQRLEQNPAIAHRGLRI